MDKVFDILKIIEHKYTDILGGKLVGIYVHGSIAFNCFNFDKSDIDFLVVINDKLSLSEKEALITVLIELDDIAPSKGFEMSVVHSDVLKPFVYPTPYELHFGSEHLINAKNNLSEFCLNMNGVDIDLASHVEVINNVGITLCGAAIKDVFAKVNKAHLIDSNYNDIISALDSIADNSVYYILNLCRFIAYLEDEYILSKRDGGIWAIKRLPSKFEKLINNAVDYYTNNTSFVEKDNLTEFAHYAINLIENKMKDLEENKMFIVKPEALMSKEDPVLLDCRYVMTEPKEGPFMYAKSHIVGAQYVNLDKDLVAEIKAHGGRHPLKDLDDIKLKLESLGVSDDKAVFIYDDGQMPMAAVLWFVLQLLGVDAYVVEGGYNALVSAGFAVTDQVSKAQFGKIKSAKRLDMRADINDVRSAIDDNKVALVDARSNPRYLGLEEPFDKIAGHIPGAINIFWQDLLNDNNCLKSVGELNQIFSVLDGYDEIIFQCGSGITGAVALLIYTNLGKKARLYSGSYSDYISYKGNKLIIKDGVEITL